MHSLRRHSRTARLAWIALLLLSLVWQPALMAASRVHASDHLVRTGHTLDAMHDDHGIPADEAGASQADADEADAKVGNALHALMHVAHCCGLASALPPGTLHMAPHVSRMPPPTARVSRAHSVQLPTPLRPPIHG